MDHTPRPLADPSQEWRGTAAGALSQEWRGNIYHHQQRNPARSGGELHSKPSARNGKGPTTTHTSHTHTNTSSKPQPREGRTSNHTPPTPCTRSL